MKKPYYLFWGLSALFLISAFSTASDGIEYVLTGIAVAGLFGWLGYKNFNKLKPTSNSKPTPGNTIKVPERIDGKFGKYKYHDVSILTTDEYDIDFASILGKKVSFSYESAVSHKNLPVSVTVDGIRIGFMPKGRLGDMCIDWINRKDPIFSVVSSVDKAKKEIQIFLAFYKYEPKDFDFEDEFSDDEDEEFE